MNIKFGVIIARVVIFLILSSHLLYANRATYISGYKKNNPVEKKSEYIQDIKVANDQQIYSAMDFIKQYDIKYYFILKKLQSQDFNLFVTRLEKWLNENNIEKTNYKKSILYSKLKSLQKNARVLAESYKEEEDTDKQKKLKKELRNVLRKIFEDNLKIKKLSIQRKKQEVAKLETNIYYKNKKKKELINLQLTDYLH